MSSGGSGYSSAENSGAGGSPAPVPSSKVGGGGGGDKQKEKVRVSKTSAILWHAHQNDLGAVRKLLEEDPSLVSARDYDNRTPLHVASLHGWIDVAKCLIEFGADVNAQDRWRNTGQNGSHFEPKPVPPPQPNKCDWEIDPSELDFSNSALIGKGSFGEIVKAYWRGTPVAVKRILPSLSDDKLVIQDFRHEVNLLVKLRHPNIVQFLGAVTEKKPLMLITEYLRGGDLHLYLKEKGALSPLTAINFALDIARYSDRYMAPEVFKHRKYDKKVDVFSFGMILYQMLEGDPPLSNYEPYEAAKYVAEGHRPTFRSKGSIPELRELTEQCWAADVNRRPSFLEIIKRLEKIKDRLSSKDSNLKGVMLCTEIPFFQRDSDLDPELAYQTLTCTTSRRFLDNSDCKSRLRLVTTSQGFR
ncbi:hypothetical protein Cgig2_031309 [Carnegiea gigantea]|uniref:Protein kinase domain-containing protein n=1 Tax=Carnegiea gigantea TaxID=171969 RepID=A0A9Q1KJD5_9CARY|nr:hypothetical protein Cgig2_031309 [Carnegiea gigantea]